MTITVRSNEPIAPVEAVVGTVEEKQSAPEAEKPSEQNETSEDSESLETEQVEATEEESDSEESNESEGDKPKKKSGFKRRIDKLNARVAERERELEYWKQQALKEKQAEPAKETVSKAQDQGKPNPENFDSHAEYVEALTDWKVEQKYLAQKQEEEKSKFMTEQQKAVQAYTERAKSFSEKVEDYDDVLASVDDIMVPAAIQNLIVQSANGPELAYEMAKDRENLARICKLPILEAVFEIGSIKAKIASKGSEEKLPIKKPTSAPKPIATVGKGAGAIVKSIADPNLSQAEYEKLRAEQMKKRA